MAEGKYNKPKTHSHNAKPWFDFMFEANMYQTKTFLSNASLCS